MKDLEILQLFLNKGLQLNKDSLEFFSENKTKIPVFFELIKNEKAFKPTITIEVVKKYLEPLSKGIEIKKTFSIPTKNNSIEEYISFFQKRYENIKKILSKRIELINLISVNKVTEKTKKFSLIGIVKEKNPNEIVIEDLSGEISLQVNDEIRDELNVVVEDEVIGLVCINKNNDFFVEKIVFPDFPLKTKIKTAPEDFFCLFVSGEIQNPQKLLTYLEKFDKKLYVFFLNNSNFDFKDLEEKFPNIKFFTSLPDPVIVVVGGIEIFLSSGKFLEKYKKIFNKPTVDVLLSLIRKRHLNPLYSPDAKIDSDLFFLDDVPEIFAVNYFNEPAATNYKGSTLISVGSFETNPVFWLINLKTRENIRVEL